MIRPYLLPLPILTEFYRKGIRSVRNDLRNVRNDLRNVRVCVDLEAIHLDSDQRPSLDHKQGHLCYGIRITVLPDRYLAQDTDLVKRLFPYRNKRPENGNSYTVTISMSDCCDIRS